MGMGKWPKMSTGMLMGMLIAIAVGKLKTEQTASPAWQAGSNTESGPFTIKMGGGGAVICL